MEELDVDSLSLDELKNRLQRERAYSSMLETEFDQRLEIEFQKKLDVATKHRIAEVKAESYQRGLSESGRGVGRVLDEIKAHLQHEVADKIRKIVKDAIEQNLPKSLSGQVDDRLIQVRPRISAEYDLSRAFEVITVSIPIESRINFSVAVPDSVLREI